MKKVRQIADQFKPSQVHYLILFVLSFIFLYLTKNTIFDEKLPTYLELERYSDILDNFKAKNWNESRENWPWIF